ncbi:MAG: Hsp33 family molecular chaperone HslO [Xanthomonadaceae bacterium]|jgi:molecular chaperone Hsp33|nr:Hsp33 family molecular chaperone HslO [Xanthomonadaceae bacterium]
MTSSDLLTRFLLPQAGIRGVHVRLDPSWKTILRHGGKYPPIGTSLLGEATVAAALFTGHAKLDGHLSIQLRTNPGSAVRSLFAECTAAGTIRSIMRLADGSSDAPSDLRELGKDALLAITVENPGLDPSVPQRYQSLVTPDAPHMNQIFEAYFKQSEQLPTRLLLAASDQEAVGLFLQKLPDDAGDDDGWTRINMLFDTLEKSELLTTPMPALLNRLFHEENPEILGEKPLRFGCSCSRERVVAMLQALGKDEAFAATEGTGTAEVLCEFCGRQYRFSATEIMGLFENDKVLMNAPDRLQ